MLTYRDAARIEALARRHRGQVRIVDAKKAYVPLGDDPVKTPGDRRARPGAAADGFLIAPLRK